MQIISKP